MRFKEFVKGAKEEALIALAFCLNGKDLLVQDGKLFKRVEGVYIEVDSSLLETLADDFKFGRICKLNEEELDENGQIIYGQFYTELCAEICAKEDRLTNCLHITGDTEFLLCTECGNVQVL